MDQITNQMEQITTCCDKSDGFSHDKLSAISSAQIASDLTQNIFRATFEEERKTIDQNCNFR